MRLLPLLLLAACGDPTLYPKWGGVVGTVAPVDTGLLPVVALACGRSDEGTVAQLTVVNEGPEAYELFTVDDGCNQVFQVVLPPGEVHLTTVANHLAWAVYDGSGRRVSTFGLPSGSGVQWVEYIP